MCVDNLFNNIKIQIFRNMRSYWLDEHNLINEIFNKNLLGHVRFDIDFVLFFIIKKFKESYFDDISVPDFGVCFSSLVDGEFDLIEEDLIVEQKSGVFGLMMISVEVYIFLDIFIVIFESGQFKNGLVCEVGFEVCVVHGVAGGGEGDSSGVCTVDFDDILNGEEVSGGLAHFLIVDVHIPVAEEPSRHLRIIPNSSMIEETHRQVVLDQVFPAAS